MTAAAHHRRPRVTAPTHQRAASGSTHGTDTQAGRVLDHHQAITSLPFLSGLRFLPYWGPVLRLSYPVGPTIEVGLTQNAWGPRSAYVFDHVDPKSPPRDAADELEVQACEIAYAEYHAAERGHRWGTSAPNTGVANAEAAARVALRAHLRDEAEVAA